MEAIGQGAHCGMVGYPPSGSNGVTPWAETRKEAAGNQLQDAMGANSSQDVLD